MTALALNCAVSEYTKFDRKNYPYPDLMKGYQISQYDSPIGKNGWIMVDSDGQRKKIGIIRVHLEEDVAKLTHCNNSLGESYSLVDANRAGVPLMEIVGSPDIRSPEEARQYLIKLRSILQYLGVSTGNMEEGSFRCDANISLRPKGSQEFLAKVEVKNMNSFKAVYEAMAYEAERQRKVLEKGERIVQETRGWVDEKGITVSQRSKEQAHDYRYFPEPDLPPLVLSREWVESIRSRLPELPEARKERFMQELGLSQYDAALLTNSKAMADYFESCLRDYTGSLSKTELKKKAKTVANWLLGEFSRLLNATGKQITEAPVTPHALNELLQMVEEGKINLATAKTVFEEMFQAGKTAPVLVAERGLAQVSDTAELARQVKEVLSNNARAVADYKAGKEQAFSFLLGQLMKATKGRANPKVARELLQTHLRELSGKS
jgi:aspartyl-tRNA(Asn)/glutamyl-tRNA(Gln) amidotransferase subunit B